MLKLTRNIVVAGKIASLYCKQIGKVNCRLLVKRRITNLLNDKVFNNPFLANIEWAQYFSFVRNVDEYDQDYSDVYLDGFDILTGAKKSFKVKSVPYDQVGSMNRIVEIMNDNNRGLIFESLGKINDRFVLKMVGEGTNYNVSLAQIFPKVVYSGNEPVYVDPPNEGATGNGNGEEDEAGFDIKKILIPALLAAAYFLIG